MSCETVLELIRKTDSKDVTLITRDRLIYYTAKRIFDFAAAFFAVVFLLPLMALIVLVIRIDSPGPAIFIQERVGSKRKVRDRFSYWEHMTFPCFKFRTMHHNVDTSLHERFVRAYINNDLEEMNSLQGGSHVVRKLTNDPRVTRVGKLLRKTSLDELPQLWNVVRGDMSIVGPRPAIPYELAYYKPWHFQRLQALPGLTGLWQICARNSTDFDEGVLLDIEYIRKQSFLVDMGIIFKTPLAVIFGKSAM